MNVKQKEIISAGCSIKEIRRLDDMIRQKKNPIRIKAKQTALLITALYRINRETRRKGA